MTFGAVLSEDGAAGRVVLRGAQEQLAQQQKQAQAACSPEMFIEAHECTLVMGHQARN
jgi:hypothetical protein